MSTKTAARPQPGNGRTRASRAKTSRVERARATAALASRQRRRYLLLWGVVLAAVAALIGVMMWSARPTVDANTRPAPDFALTDTNGATVHLADYRGRHVVLYFNEGAGCQSCLYQMADIEQHFAEFRAANIVVLPIVMNTAAQIKADMAANGVRTPFLLDDGTVSTAYGTLGKGMHPGLPGHSFVYIDANGTQRWYGEYPSMYLSATDLLNQVRQHMP
ncbi:MAG: redoxin domain-containing protein [Micromonosporaceae bacterium]